MKFLSKTEGITPVFLLKYHLIGTGIGYHIVMFLEFMKG